MAQLHKMHSDDIKRTLRKLKKLELKLRYNYSHDRSTASSKAGSIELVWNKFFDLKDICTSAVKYSFSQLSQMTKEEVKEIINEYFYHVYYWCCKENQTPDNTLIDPELLNQLGLPAYVDAEDIKRRFRELAKIYHPDNGGDNERFIDLIEKYNNIRS